MTKRKESSKLIFNELYALTEKSRYFSGTEIRDKLKSKSDKRYPVEYLQKLIDYNKTLLDFLEIEPHIVGNYRDVSIWFKTGRYIGAVPLRSPDHGKTVGDLVVNPRYSNDQNKMLDYCEIVTMLEDEIEPEYNYSFPLVSEYSLRPPAYLVASKYIGSLFGSLDTSWQRFQTRTACFHYPKSNIDWKKYVAKEYFPDKKLQFPCRVNELSLAHKEMFELKYTFELASKIISEPSTPINIKIWARHRIISINEKFAKFLSKPTNEIIIHGYDPPRIQSLKTQANHVLKLTGNEIVAWRIDLSQLFEKYVQHIFTKIARGSGASKQDNVKMPIVGKQQPLWTMKYLEPDIVISRGSKQVFVDAKYKSHMYNQRSDSTQLKDEHRRDLHQILAYMSFSPEKNKLGFLCYPASGFQKEKIGYIAGNWNTHQTIYLIGLPMKRNETDKTVGELIRIVLREFEDPS